VGCPGDAQREDITGTSGCLYEPRQCRPLFTGLVEALFLYVSMCKLRRRARAVSRARPRWRPCASLRFYPRRASVAFAPSERSPHALLQLQSFIGDCTREFVRASHKGQQIRRHPYFVDMANAMQRSLESPRALNVIGLPGGSRHSGSKQSDKGKVCESRWRKVFGLKGYCPRMAGLPDFPHRSVGLGAKEL
jgi:hypothetical protein